MESLQGHNINITKLKNIFFPNNERNFKEYVQLGWRDQCPQNIGRGILAVFKQYGGRNTDEEVFFRVYQ